MKKNFKKNNIGKFGVVMRENYNSYLGDFEASTKNIDLIVVDPIFTK